MMATILSGFWPWLGALVLIMAVLQGIAEIVKAWRSKP